MAKKRETESMTDNSLLTGEVLTAQQRQQAAAERKANAKAEKRHLRQQMRDEAMTRIGGSGKVTGIILLLIAVLLVGSVVLAVTQSGGHGWDPKEGSTYYLDTLALPEMGEVGISACINEAYYTNNGGMYLQMTFANAESTTQHPTRIEVKLLNKADEVITHSISTDPPERYFVNAGQYKTFELRIPAEFVDIPDDALDVISYEITVECEEYQSTDGD